MLEQKQRGEPHDLGLGGKQRQQQAGQPDRLLAKRHAHMHAAAARRIALVEDQVDHRRHSAQPARPLRRVGHLVGQAELADAALGAGDALLHRLLADQEGAGDLLHRKAGDDPAAPARSAGWPAAPGGSRRTAASEGRPDSCPASSASTSAASRSSRSDSVSSGGSAVLRASRRTASSAALRPTKISQAAGSRGRPLSGQLRSALRLASWKASSARVQVAEIAQQRAHRLRPRRDERPLDGAAALHQPPRPGRKRPTGRIS